MAAACVAVLACSFACSKPDQEKMDQKTEAARESVRDAAHRVGDDARKLGREMKADASDLSRNVDHAINSTGSTSNGAAGAEEELRKGEQDLRAAGHQAGVKLDRAATIAKVKSKLVSDVGLSTVAAIDVDAIDGVVTLKGSVTSEDRKNQAAEAVKQVDGVTRVINQLVVKP